jgi:hypothetical protein
MSPHFAGKVWSKPVKLDSQEEVRIGLGGGLIGSGLKFEFSVDFMVH